MKENKIKVNDEVVCLGDTVRIQVIDGAGAWDDVVTVVEKYSNNRSKNAQEILNTSLIGGTILAHKVGDVISVSDLNSFTVEILEIKKVSKKDSIASLKSQICVGDMVELRVTLKDGKCRDLFFLLVSRKINRSELDSNIKQVVVTSPIGRLLARASISDVFSYQGGKYQILSKKSFFLPVKEESQKFRETKKETMDDNIRKFKHNDLKNEPNSKFEQISYQLTREKYDELVKKLEFLKKERISLAAFGKESNENLASDVWHSNARMGFLEELRQLDEKIISIKNILKHAEIIERTNYSDLVNIGDVVLVCCTFLEEEPEEMWVRLVTYVDGKQDRYIDDVMSISTNSEVGKAILGQKIGNEVILPNVQVKILRKRENPELIKFNDVVEVIHEQEGFYKEVRVLMFVKDIPGERIDGIEYVTVQDPIGRAIQNRNVGEMARYKVNGESHMIQILGKLSFEEMKENLRNLKKDND